MIKHSKTLALLALGLLLAGCNMAPHYVRPDLPVAPSVSSGIGQGADTQAQASDAAPMAWKDYFTDARLRAVIGLSLENNRDLRVAVAHIAQARARYKVQGADLFPTISAGASGDIAQVPSGLSGLTGGSGGSAGGPANSTRYNLYRGQLGVSAWEIDLFGRVRNLTQAAQEEYFASIDNRAAAQSRWCPKWPMPGFSLRRTASNWPSLAIPTRPSPRRWRSRRTARRWAWPRTSTCNRPGPASSRRAPISRG
jgi:multidrug efflux system outer membrane protein